MDKVLQAISNMSKREQIILAMVLVLGLGSVFFVFEYEVQIKKKQEYENQAKSMTQSINALQMAVQQLRPQETKAQIASTNLEILQMENQIRMLRTRMSGKPVDVIRALRQKAQRFNIRMERVTTDEEPVINGGVSYREVTLRLLLESNYSAIPSFIQALEELPTILSVKKLEVLRDKDILPAVQTQITIHMVAL